MYLKYVKHMTGRNNNIALCALINYESLLSAVIALHRDPVTGKGPVICFYGRNSDQRTATSQKRRLL